MTSDYEDIDYRPVFTAAQARQLHTLHIDSWYHDGDGGPGLGGGPALPGLRRLRVGYLPDENWGELLSGDYCQSLHRLDLGFCYSHNPKMLEHLAKASLPELRCLSLGATADVSDLAPLVESNAMPNLCTLLLPWVHVPVSATNLRPLARAKGMPHLSLVCVQPSFQPQWWVLGGGKATKVRKGVRPLDGDWWLGDTDVLC
jgi:hypothetical protein